MAVTFRAPSSANCANHDRGSLLTFGRTKPMKYTQTLLLTLLALAGNGYSGPIKRPIDTTIKGTNGTEAKMIIIGIWADGFHIAQPSGRPPLFITWDKVDLIWLEAERGDINILKAKSTKFPVVEEQEARRKIDEVRKTFRAPRTFTYIIPTSDLRGRTNTVPNALAERYASKLKVITPGNITQSIKHIVVDVERDAVTLGASSGQADKLQVQWLTTSFVSFLGRIERVQRELDPLYAGEVAMPKIQGKTQDPFRPAQEENWFE